MPFQVSPGVNVTEIDLTTIVPAVSTTEGAIAGIFKWGPAETTQLVTSESDLYNRFGKPTSDNFETWFTAANFLAYGNKLYVSRAVAANSYNAGASVSDDFTLTTVTLSSAGTGGSYVPGDTLTVVGGSFNTVATVNVTATEVRTIAVVASNTGTGYANGDTITFADGTATTNAVFVVTTGASNTSVVSLAISNRGEYTANPTLANNATTALTGAGTGLRVTTTTRAKTVAVKNAGSYIVQPDTLAGNIPTGGSGTGISLNITFAQGAAGAVDPTQIKNRVDYDAKAPTLDTDALYFAKYPGDLGNSIKISVCDSANAYSSALTGNSDVTVTFPAVIGSNTITVTAVSATSNTNANTMANTVYQTLQVGDFIEVGNTSIGTQYLKVKSKSTPAVTGNSTVNQASFTLGLEAPYALSTNVSPTQVTRYWEYFNNVASAPGTSPFVTAAGGTKDELHVVVVDEDGLFTGNRGQILEVWQGLSRASDAKSEQGGTIYYKDYINNGSQYIWFANHRAGYGVTTSSAISGIDTLPLTLSLSGGADGVTETTVTQGNLATAYDKFKSAEDIDISLILTGKSRFGTNKEGLVNYIIDNIAEYRKDCVVFASPDLDDVVNAPGSEGINIYAFKQSVRPSSYAFIDSGYKYQYDKYNDTYRWVPLNGDVAGTVVRTDDVRDPWFSPAGFNRGQIKNLVKLAFNPDKGNRDLLYKTGVNPVVTFPGQGTVLYGDKTALNKPSAFDRINVRRLFIVLEKAIATAAKSTLFELNDEFTRAQFRNLVEPYLRDIKGRRGIYDFRVVCDATNNTPERVDRNEFWGDIYIKPARSINFIQLNFIAVRTGVSFDEIVGKF